MNKLLQNPLHMENQYGTASNDFAVDIKQCFICAKLHSAHPGYSVTCIFPLHNPNFLLSFIQSTQTSMALQTTVIGREIISVR